MKEVILIISLLFLLLCIGHLEVLFNPFRITMAGWRNVLSALFFIVALMLSNWSAYDKGYRNGVKDGVKEYDKMTHRFLPEVIKDIQGEFDLNVWIEKEEIRDRLEMIYKRLNILYTVKLNTIEDYFWTDDTHTKKPYRYLLKKPKRDLGDF